MTLTLTVFDAPTFTAENFSMGLPNPMLKLQRFEPDDELPHVFIPFGVELSRPLPLERLGPVVPFGYGLYTPDPEDETDDLVISFPFPEDVPDPLSAA